MLIRQIERFLRESGMSATRFGRSAVRDPRFVHDLRNGREPGRRVSERADLFMTTYRESRHAH